MNRIEKKQQSVFSFSYIDIFFLLLVGLILSVGIGFLAEVHRENMGRSHYVYVSQTVEETEYPMPVAGDVLFGKDGLQIGRVLTVETEETEGRTLLKLKCRLEGEKPSVGEIITIETFGSIRTMQVDSVESAKNDKEG